MQNNYQWKEFVENYIWHLYLITDKNNVIKCLELTRVNDALFFVKSDEFNTTIGASNIEKAKARALDLFADDIRKQINKLQTMLDIIDNSQALSPNEISKLANKSISKMSTEWLYYPNSDEYVLRKLNNKYEAYELSNGTTIQPNIKVIAKTKIARIRNNLVSYSVRFDANIKDKLHFGEKIHLAVDEVTALSETVTYLIMLGVITNESEDSADE